MPPKNTEFAAQYGESCVEFYDELYRHVDPDIVTRLYELSAGGRVLELGIGTGRMALPLAARGVDVSGIEGSPSMLAKLRSKLGGSRLRVVQGNFADVGIDGPFSLVFALVSTFFLLRSHEEQQRCFNAVAKLLSERGCFVLENFEPLGAVPITDNSTDNSSVNQQLYLARQIVGTLNGPREYRVRLCYVAPQQLDEMAHKAGLRLQGRWNNWKRRAFTPGHQMHVSAYVRG
ncbi:MAG: methyltransferase domain-containing protein [Pyrinomonadaceae bacterium]|nr:methyltransferase domain-containing protein [Pyrinomonadaceae bacterium]